MSANVPKGDQPDTMFWIIERSDCPGFIPAIKESQGLSRSDGKRPDGLTLTPWQAGKALPWDVTVVCPL